MKKLERCSSLVDLRPRAAHPPQEYSIPSSAQAHSSPRSATGPTDLALVAVFAALIAVLSLAPAIPLGGGVPITLQTLGVALTGLTLGPVRGLLSVLLYLAVGLVGLPVFAGGTAGLAVLAKPSVGYLLSFPIAALVAGLLARTIARGPKLRLLRLFVSAFAASVIVVHPAGIAGLHLVAGMDWGKAALTDLAFWPGDLVKSFLAAAIALTVHRAFPWLATGRRTVRGELAADAGAGQSSPV